MMSHFCLSCIYTQVLSRWLYFNETLYDAIDARRLHHQLIPMRVAYEDGFDLATLKGLESLQHQVYRDSVDSGFAALTAIAREGDNITAVFDNRRSGSISYV